MKAEGEQLKKRKRSPYVYRHAFESGKDTQLLRTSKQSSVQRRKLVEMVAMQLIRVIGVTHTLQSFKLEGIVIVLTHNKRTIENLRLLITRNKPAVQANGLFALFSSHLSKRTVVPRFCIRVHPSMKRASYKLLLFDAIS